MAKGGKRNVQHLPARSRTRLHKPKLADPDRNSAELNVQLQALGLRLHQTLGDGNCLFRALSDQLYGSETYHLALRAEITAWMAAHPERYAAFVEDDRGLDDHLRCMRIPGTYGGHLELSAFAHLKRKNVKVIQPGLVYVIEWSAGSPIAESFSSASDNEEQAPLSPTQEREMRRARREKLRDIKLTNKASSTDTVYVAYHDWEHFSSVRTANGQLPSMVQHTEAEEMQPMASSSSSNGKRPPRVRQRKTPSSELVPASTDIDPPIIMTATRIPLPRSPSPSTNSSSADSTASSSLAPLTPSDSNSILLVDQAKGRSPKRQLEDEDVYSGPELSEARSAKRHHPGISSQKSGLRQSHRIVDDASPPGSSRPSASTMSRPPLSASSTSDLSELSSDGEDNSVGITSRPQHVQPSSPPARLTRLQRKQLSLPKPRPRRVILTVNGKRLSGTVKPKSSSSTPSTLVEDAGTERQWAKNGNGRLDVRGFRELKI